MVKCIFLVNSVHFYQYKLNIHKNNQRLTNFEENKCFKMMHEFILISD